MGESDAATFVSDLAPSVPGFDCLYARDTLRLCLYPFWTGEVPCVLPPILLLNSELLSSFRLPVCM